MNALYHLFDATAGPDLSFPMSASPQDTLVVLCECRHLHAGLSRKGIPGPVVHPFGGRHSSPLALLGNPRGQPGLPGFLHPSSLSSPLCSDKPCPAYNSDSLRPLVTVGADSKNQSSNQEQYYLCPHRGTLFRHELPGFAWINSPNVP